MLNSYSQHLKVPKIALARVTKSLPLISVCGFVFCYFMISIYEGGDIVRYKNYFEHAKDFEFLPGYVFFRSTLGASEPVFYLITWGFSSLGITYFTYKVTIASCLFIISGATLVRLGVPLLIAITFCSTNFYLLAMYSELERFGLSIIFLLLAFHSISKNKTGWAIFFMSLSLGSHLQIFIVLLAIIIGKLSETVAVLKIKKCYGKKSFLRNIFLFIIIGAAILIFIVGPLGAIFKQTVNHKIEHYTGTLSIGNLLQAALFFPLMLLMSKNRYRDTVIYAIFSIGILIFGGERLNIFIAMFVLLLAFANKRWANPLALAAQAYFTAKGLAFLLLAIESGRGYA